MDQVKYSGVGHLALVVAHVHCLLMRDGKGSVSWLWSWIWSYISLAKSGFDGPCSVNWPSRVSLGAVVIVDLWL